jgi:predicted RNase H-like HicB family nuclease
MSREFYVVIEKDEDGFFVGEVPQLKACYSQGKTIDELMVNMKEVIGLALLEQGDVEPSEFVGVQKLMGSSPGLNLTGGVCCRAV